MPVVSTTITVTTSIYAPMDEVWDKWTLPEHITQRNFASDDWECSKAVNDIRDGGRFSYRMAAKDDSFSFEFSGKYTNVIKPTLIEYRMDDGRMATISFLDEQCGTIKISETFEAEKENPVDMQKAGWQAILDNFKKYVESK